MKQLLLRLLLFIVMCAPLFGQAQSISPLDLVPPVRLQVSADVSLEAGQQTVLHAVGQQASSALAFDGVDDIVRIPDAATPSQSAHLADISNTFTVEAWVWPTAPHEIDSPSRSGVAGTSGQRYLIFPTGGWVWGDQNNQAGMGLSIGTNGVSVYEHTGNYMPAVLVWAGTLTGWTHVAVVYEGRRPNLYINGRLVARGLWGGVGAVHPSLSFGGGSYGYFQGGVAEVRLWNTARTPRQIQQSQLFQVSAADPTLVGDWRLAEGQGSVAADFSANQLTGQLMSEGGSTATGPTWVNAPPSSAPVAYNWSPALGLSSATGASVTASPAKTTVYTVKATGEQANSLTQSTITVNIASSCQAVPITVSSPQTITSGQAASLHAKASPIGSATTFDGLADLLLLPSPATSPTSLSTTLTNTFTVEAWVKPAAPHEIDQQSSGSVDGVSGQHYLLFPDYEAGNSLGDDHAGMGISVGTNGVSVYEHAANYMPPLLVWEGAITDWTHLAVVYENRVPVLYINGEFKKRGIAGWRPFVHPSFEVGNGTYGNYQGDVHELRIWRTARTADQIATTFQQAASGTEPDLAGCWHLDEGTGVVAHDATAAHQDGELSLAHWQVPATAPALQPVLRWSPTIELSAATGETVTASPMTTTTYTVTVASGTSCTPSQARVTVTVDGTIVLPPDNPSENRERNWTLERSFDGDGNEVAASKQFTDGLGRPTQAQARNAATQQVFAAQTIYNTGGQPVLQTLAAPTNNQSFNYKEDFVTVGGTTLDHTNFEGPKASAPDQVDATAKGTLGYYFSQRNEQEPLTPITNYPYSLTEPYDGPLGGTRRAAGPGDELRMGKGREAKGRDFPLRKEFDSYLSLRPQFVPGSPLPTLQYQGMKSVSVNADGRESIVVTNKEDQAIIACLSGAQYPGLPVFGYISAEATNRFDADAPAYQDIHIPAAGPQDVKFTMGSEYTQGGRVLIVNLLTQDTTSYAIKAASAGVEPEQHVMLAPGFYRFVSVTGTQWSYYEAHYGNFSYTYYDDAGRAIATIAPNGLKDSMAPSQPTFVTRNTYDTSGRLLATESDEEGRSEYVYAQDGRIRFSQSALQRPAGRFSYSNYDEVGRVVESGEYTPATAPITTKPLTEQLLPLSTPFQSAPYPAWKAATNGVVYPDYCVAYLNDLGNYVEFTVQVPQAGAYTLNLSYAAGAPNRTMTVVVNGTATGQVAFPQTDSGLWSTYATKVVATTLQAGANTIRLENRPGDSGAINFASLQLTAQGSGMDLASLIEERVPTNSLDGTHCAQRNQVWYDLAFDGTPGSQGDNRDKLLDRRQEFVVGAVAKTQNDNVTTWYSYDELGRVTWVVQDIKGVGVKTLDYQYDFSGNVLQVAYQKGQPDSFYHYYGYDAAQRLTSVYTSPDGATQTLQAQYTYYLHGPLKRVQVAGNLQGIDYVYTLQGALKSINHATQTLEPGHDSPTTNGVYKDLFALTLEYFSGDYRSRSIDVPAPPLPPVAGAPVADRFDGTIRSANWRTGASADIQRMAYTYDEKSQLQNSTYSNWQLINKAYQLNTASTKSFQEGGLDYDPNGNIMSLKRTGATGNPTDDFSYTYKANTNQLQQVHTAGALPNTPPVLDYDYDALGQMTRQTDEQGARYFTYDVTGKTTGVYLDKDHQQPLVTFAYDDRGFRVSKTAYPLGGGAAQTTTYVRDVAGNILAVYAQAAPTAPVQRIEVPVYGSGRLGTLTHLADGSDDYRYELTDHLGDARVVFHRPTTQVQVETMELGGVPSQAAFLNDDRYRVAVSGAPSGDYVARLTDSQPAGQELKRVLTVTRGDTITFSALAQWKQNAAAGGTSATPFVLLGAAAGVNALSQRGAEGQTTTYATTNSNWLSLLAAGLGFTFGQGAPANLGATSLEGWIKYRVLDAQGNLMLDAQGHPLAGVDYLLGTGKWEYLQTGVRVPQDGTIEVMAGTLGTGEAVYFDNLRVEQTGGLIVQEQHQYAFGAPLPGLSYTVGNKRYRYGYQGKYAEHDDETGFESFDLRLYNSRLGRWLTADPEGQFRSCYEGVGNNPISNVDPDGGWSLLGAGIGTVIGAGVGGAISSSNGDGFWRGAAIGAGAGFLFGGILGPKVESKKSLSNDWMSRSFRADWKIGVNIELPCITLPKLPMPVLAFTLRIPMQILTEMQKGSDINYTRTTQTSESTMGNFSIGKAKISGYILEPSGPSTTASGTDHRIPAGTYNLALYSSSAHPDALSVTNSQVSYKRRILIHNGNYPGDTEGCLLVGSTKGPNFVGGSVNMLKRIMKYYHAHGTNGSKLIITESF